MEQTQSCLTDARVAGGPVGPPSHGLEGFRHGFGIACIDSIWLCLAISLIVALLYTLALMGSVPLNPHNVGWMIGYPAEYYIAILCSVRTDFGLPKSGPRWDFQ